MPPPKLESHPGVNAANIGFYVIDRKRAGAMSLYSAYLLMHEALRLERRCYVEPAYPQKLTIKGLLKLYLDYLTATAVQCEAEAKESAQWFVSDIPLLQEKRAHFLADRLAEGAALLTDRGFWQTLAAQRKKSANHAGPYPDEVFPFEFAAPEQELLAPGSDKAFQEERVLDDESSEFYVQLQLHEG